MEPAMSRKRGRRAGRILALCAVLAGALAYGAHWWTQGRFIESTDDAYVGGDVTVIAPRISGYVAHILVEDNQHVRAGQLLAVISDPDYRAQLDAAIANVHEHLAALSRLAAQRTLDETLIDEAQAVLVSRKSTAAFTESKAQRYRDLLGGHAVSIEDAQRTRSESDVAAAAVVAARSSLEAAGKRLTVVDAQIAEENAAVAKARAERQSAALNLGYTKLYAPVDGYVGNRSVQAGSYVGPGRQMMAIVPAHGLWVDANFKEDQIAGMRVGTPVRVVADVAPSSVWHGSVVSVAPASGAVFSIIPTENATGNFTKIVQRVPVRIALEDAASSLGTLRPGLSVTVRADTRASRDGRP